MYIRPSSWATSILPLISSPNQALRSISRLLRACFSSAETAPGGSLSVECVQRCLCRMSRSDVRPSVALAMALTSRGANERSGPQFCCKQLGPGSFCPAAGRGRSALEAQRPPNQVAQQVASFLVCAQSPPHTRNNSRKVAFPVEPTKLESTESGNKGEVCIH